MHVLKPDIQNMPPKYQNIFNRCWNVFVKNQHRNRMLSRYYESENVVKNIGIAVPPTMEALGVAVGWPRKAVTYLSDRSVFGGFRVNDAAADSILSELADENDVGGMYQQLTRSELIHGPAFVTVSRSSRGVDIVAHSALGAACVVETEGNRRRVLGGISVGAINEKGKPTSWNLWADDAIVAIDEVAPGRWFATVQPQPSAVPFIVPFVYESDLGKPFGNSRISRPVIAATNSALRTLLREELSEELFAAPQKFILGADETLFSPTIEDEETGEEIPNPRYKSRLETYLGSLLVMSRDDNGDIPQIGQLPATGVSDQIGYFKHLAGIVSGETGIPLASLGVVQDSNPSSAEAMEMSRVDIVETARSLNLSNSAAMRQVGLMALAIAENAPYEQIRRDYGDLKANMLDPVRPSIAARADAMTKWLAAAPYLADCPSWWADGGWSESQISDFIQAKAAYDARQSAPDAVV